VGFVRVESLEEYAEKVTGLGVGSKCGFLGLAELALV
jgi:translation elongation factor EF-4